MTAPLRILAFSDLHGLHYPVASNLIDDLGPDRVDWIVLCGDLLPDFPRISGQGPRLQAQRDFWQVYRRTFLRDWATTTLVRGNHELEGFHDPALTRLPPALEGRVVRLEGIPAEFGAWGFSREWEADALEAELEDQLRLAPEPALYLSHVPPCRCLDANARGQAIGHRPLARHLEARGWPAALVLCGHVHEGFGAMARGRTQVVNAACGYALLHWRPDGAEVIAMGRLDGGGQ